MLPGQQRRIVTPGKNEKFYLAGALDVRTGTLHTTGLAHKGAALFCTLLRDLAEHYGSARRIHLVVDNYAIHSARMTRRTLDELGGRIVLHFLPPYCPDANRIERVWQDLHANVTRNHRCKTMKALLGKFTFSTMLMVTSEKFPFSALTTCAGTENTSGTNVCVGCPVSSSSPRKTLYTHALGTLMYICVAPTQ
jgi:transposase